MRNEEWGMGNGEWGKAYKANKAYKAYKAYKANKTYKAFKAFIAFKRSRLNPFQNYRSTTYFSVD